MRVIKRLIFKKGHFLMLDCKISTNDKKDSKQRIFHPRNILFLVFFEYTVDPNMIGVRHELYV